MYLELIVSFLSLAVAIYAILIARTANKRSQAAIDHSLPAVSYGHGHFDGNIVHYFSVKGGMMDGWHIQKIDLSKGRSDVRVGYLTKTPQQMNLESSCIVLNGEIGRYVNLMR